MPKLTSVWTLECISSLYFFLCYIYCIIQHCRPFTTGSNIRENDLQGLLDLLVLSEVSTHHGREGLDQGQVSSPQGSQAVSMSMPELVGLPMHVCTCVMHMCVLTCNIYVCVFMSVSKFIPQCTYNGERTVSGVCLDFHLLWPRVLFSLCRKGLFDPESYPFVQQVVSPIASWKFSYLHFSSCCTNIGILDVYDCITSKKGFLELNPGPHAEPGRVLFTELAL